MAGPVIFNIPQPNFFASSFGKLSDYEVDLATVFMKSELCLVAERWALENAHLACGWKRVWSWR